MCTYILRTTHTREEEEKRKGQVFLPPSFFLTELSSEAVWLDWMAAKQGEVFLPFHSLPPAALPAKKIPFLVSKALYSILLPAPTEQRSPRPSLLKCVRPSSTS